VQPVKTRWGTYVNMLSSLLKHRRSLEQAIKHDEFTRLARSARSGLDSAAQEVEADEQIKDLTAALAGEEARASPQVPEGVARNPRYAAVYQCISDESFWTAARAYVKLNEPVASTIATISGDSVCLSDAVYLVMVASKIINAVTYNDMSSVFDSQYQVEELKRLWAKRADHMTGFSHLALLLDPRPQFREFVKRETLIVGDTETKNVGNTEFLSSADSCLREMADIVLHDTHKTVVERSKKMPTVALVDVKQALLTGALRAFIGVHQSKKLKHLNISEDKLKQFGVDGEAPVSFWVHDVPHDCLLREAAIRVMSAKPSSTAVERLWNAFGDNLTAKRRSMKNSTLSELVYAKMNVDLLDTGDGKQLTDIPLFESVLDFVDAVIEEEDAEQLGSGADCASDADMVVSEDGGASSSGSGDADAW
jgi:hypothetical protein